jgi:hypothetical protein
MTTPTREEIERLVAELLRDAAWASAEEYETLAVHIRNAAAEIRRLHSLPGGALAASRKQPERHRP